MRSESGVLRITIELVPLGDESRAEVLSEMYITNTGGNAERPTFGDYIATIDCGRDIGWRGVVYNFARLRKGPWELLREVLNERG